MANYQPIMGLEVHVELATKSKMFCGCPADHFGKKPNTQTCPVCLGLPGALPVPNKKAVEWTILLGLALGCEIPEQSKFDRKNYFYPDIPKGYQISQYDQPLAINGSLELSNKPITQLSNNQANESKKKVRIRRVHLEEDTGKLQHASIPTSSLVDSALRGAGDKVSLVDFNRSGVPLVEIVTEPDFRSIEEVDTYLKKLQQIIRYLGISEAEMEKGTMRLEPSISLQAISPQQSARSKNELPLYRVELKNINSFRFARKALEYEIKRQTELLEAGQTPTQQTRGWNEGKNATVPQREKEEAEDYRYFPEPDIPPMRVTKDHIAKIKSQIGELPDSEKERFMKQYGLNNYDATLLVDTTQKANFFEDAVSCLLKTKSPVTPKDIANWMINRQIDLDTFLPSQLVKSIVSAGAQDGVDGEKLGKVISEVLKENPKAVEEYKAGKEQVIMFLIGQVMKKTHGKVDRNVLPDLLKKALR